MIMFLLIFLLVYGSLHLYFFFKAKAALGFGMGTGIFLVLFLLLMVFAPILIRMLERPGLEPAARVIAYIGYTWMGILALFFCISILIDLLRFFVWLGGLITAKNLSSITSVTLLHFLVPFCYLSALLFMVFSRQETFAQRG
jgi:hypothetical protein